MTTLYKLKNSNKKYECFANNIKDAAKKMFAKTGLKFMKIQQAGCNTCGGEKNKSFQLGGCDTCGGEKNKPFQLGGCDTCGGDKNRYFQLGGCSSCGGEDKRYYECVSCPINKKKSMLRISRGGSLGDTEFMNKTYLTYTIYFETDDSAYVKEVFEKNFQKIIGEIFDVPSEYVLIMYNKYSNEKKATRIHFIVLGVKHLEKEPTKNLVTIQIVLGKNKFTPISMSTDEVKYSYGEIIEELSSMKNHAQYKDVEDLFRRYNELPEKDLAKIALKKGMINKELYENILNA